ncbi:MAG: TatD family hydrolase [Coriobacteriia bacterium]|nr:TatD family hydrolase [Coriobacteriia bacterium]
MAEPLFVDAKGREVATPDFGGPVADTHAHLDMLEDPGLALANAARTDVDFIATVADPSEDASRTFDSLDIWFARAREILDAEGLSDTPLPDVRTIVGVHPHNAKDLTPEVEAELRRLARHALTSAIGEIGLDYHYDYSPRDVQREAFRRQLAIAHELDLPVVVHLREAHEDGEAILRELGLPQAGCILHCYNLGPEPLGRFLALGCTVSFAGPVTFKKADEVREAAALVPLDRILTETDCPFMTPEPFRGRKNEPAYTLFTAARLTEARDETPALFAAAAYANARRLLDRSRG